MNHFRGKQYTCKILDKYKIISLEISFISLLILTMKTTFQDA